MKRSEALKLLSHQHHQGLFAALQLKRVSGESAAEAQRVFLDFYEREGERHFSVEEQLLLPAYARHTESDRPEIVRVLTEHVDLRLRRQDVEASADPDPSALRERRAARAPHPLRGARALSDDRSGSSRRRAQAARRGFARAEAEQG